MTDIKITNYDYKVPQYKSPELKTETFLLALDMQGYILVHTPSGQTLQVSSEDGQTLIEYGYDQLGKWSDECFNEGCGEAMFDIFNGIEKMLEDGREIAHIAETQGRSQARYYANN